MADLGVTPVSILNPIDHGCHSKHGHRRACEHAPNHHRNEKRNLEAKGGRDFRLRSVYDPQAGLKEAYEGAQALGHRAGYQGDHGRPPGDMAASARS